MKSSKTRKKKDEPEEEVYLNYTIEKLVIKNCKKVSVILSGQPPTNPPCPPGGCK
jgi:hypothetical protein